MRQLWLQREWFFFSFLFFFLFFLLLLLVLAVPQQPGFRGDYDRMIHAMKLLEEFSKLADANALIHSPKLQILFYIVEETFKAKERVLVFSHSILALDFVENALKERNPEIKLSRFDGKSSAESRAKKIKDFQTEGTAVTVFLISTVAGGLGINLTAANRVVMLDIDWNPCHDEQAIPRVFRFGQTKNVFIYRLLMYGTFDETIYKNTVNKQGLSK